MRRRRIWCETCPWSDLVAEGTLALLSTRGLEPIVAVRPGDLAAVSALERTFTDAGVGAAYWPMLDDADGRWAAAGNVRRFGDFARGVAAQVPGRELIVDLEPPIEPSRDLSEVVVEPEYRRGPLLQR